MIHLFGFKARLMLEAEDGNTFEVPDFLLFKEYGYHKLNVPAVSDAIQRNYETKPKRPCPCEFCPTHKVHV